VLVNDNKLSGIIDWGDIHVGNPGTDLAIGFMILSDNALKTFFDTYGSISEEEKNIALFRTFTHSLALLAYCYEKNERPLKKWSLLALKNAIEKVLLVP
jgi:aminoglycoside phosphotransferase (APT) family kinase protein